MPTEIPLKHAYGSASTLALLLRKEFLAFGPRERFFVFGVFLLATLQTLFVDEAFFLLGVALAICLTVYVPVVEWFQETNPMLHSLPVRRETVVLGRYLVAVAAGGIGGLAWGATGHLLLPVFQAGRTSPAMWATPEGILSFVLAFGLFVVLFFPLYFRMGMAKGSLAFLAVCLALLGLGYGTAGMAWGPAVGGEGGLIPPSALFRARITALLGTLGIAGTLSLILIALASAGALSLSLSQRWYRAREF